MSKLHTFHIPVMGIGFTLETPIKVAHLGIDSVVSLVDDILIEKVRKIYCEKFELPYKEITENIEDFRAKRITSYLNLMNDLAEKKLEEFKAAAIEKGNEMKEYINMLPDSSTIKDEFKKMKDNGIKKISDWFKNTLSLGSIDVNIMTKIDKDNYKDGEKLPIEYNDGHAAIRGYAQSNLASSVVLSAGINPSLYGYMEQFDDFFPDKEGNIKKKITLKVSDYRSALVQGKFLAKKGLWVSEYRIESGLNCGGHAFASKGQLLGPILSEFRDKRKELIESMHNLFSKAFLQKKGFLPEEVLPVKVTAQGGVGTAEEHDFLLEHYQLDSVGWGSPFLLVPEATTVDNATLEKLEKAEENDLYLSNISPLGVPFNNLRGNTKDVEKEKFIAENCPGSNCPKKYVALNNEFTEKNICAASRQYQFMKIKELKGKKLSEEEYKSEYNKIVEKSCICVGLGVSTLLSHNMDTAVEGEGVSVCPGPNMAYFSKISDLKDMIKHIYGKANLLNEKSRPNVFIKELNLYIDYLKNKIEEAKSSVEDFPDKYLTSFSDELKKGIDYYTKTFSENNNIFKGILSHLEKSKKSLYELVSVFEK